ADEANAARNSLRRIIPAVAGLLKVWCAANIYASRLGSLPPIETIPGPDGKQMFITNGGEIEYGTNYSCRCCGDKYAHEQLLLPIKQEHRSYRKTSCVTKLRKESGYRNLIRLSGQKNSPAGFYYLPAIHAEMPYYDASWTTSSL